jgi:hypothetical protein
MKLTRSLSFHIHNTHNLGNLDSRHYAASLQLQPALPSTTRRLLVHRGTNRPNAGRQAAPGGDLKQTAKEILQYISDSGSAEATIVASDEL